MSKENNKSNIVRLRDAYKGSVSTVIITVFLIFFCFLLPMLISVRLEASRTGDTGFSITTASLGVVWDIESNDQLKTTLLDHISYSHWNAGKYEWGTYIGTFASPFDRELVPINNYWKYFGVPVSDTYVENLRNPCNDLSLTFTDADFPNKDKTHNNYIEASLIPDIKYKGEVLRHYFGSAPYNKYGWWSESDERYRTEEINFFMELNIDDWTGWDVSLLKVYFEFYSDLPWVLLQCYAQSLNTGNTVTLFSQYKVVSNNPMWYEVEESITLNDLINIQNLELTKGNVVLRFICRGAVSNGNSNQRRAHFTPNTNIKFDAQLYGLITPERESGKKLITTFDLYCVWMVIQSIFITFLGLAMIPQYSVGSLIKRLKMLSGKK